MKSELRASVHQVLRTVHVKALMGVGLGKQHDGVGEVMGARLKFSFHTVATEGDVGRHKHVHAA